MPVLPLYNTQNLIVMETTLERHSHDLFKDFHSDDLSSQSDRLEYLSEIYQYICSRNLPSFEINEWYCLISLFNGTNFESNMMRIIEQLPRRIEDGFDPERLFDNFDIDIAKLHKKLIDLDKMERIAVLELVYRFQRSTQKVELLPCIEAIRKNPPDGNHDMEFEPA